MLDVDSVMHAKACEDRIPLDTAPTFGYDGCKVVVRATAGELGSR